MRRMNLSRGCKYSSVKARVIQSQQKMFLSPVRKRLGSVTMFCHGLVTSPLYGLITKPKMKAVPLYRRILSKKSQHSLNVANFTSTEASFSAWFWEYSVIIDWNSAWKICLSASPLDTIRSTVSLFAIASVTISWCFLILESLFAGDNKPARNQSKPSTNAASWDCSGQANNRNSRAKANARKRLWKLFRAVET